VQCEAAVKKSAAVQIKEASFEFCRRLATFCISFIFTRNQGKMENARPTGGVSYTNSLSLISLMTCCDDGGCDGLGMISDSVVFNQNQTK